MIPIGDTQPSRRVPYVTYLLIALNVFAFLVQLGQGAAVNDFILQWGAVPARLAGWTEDPFVLVTLLTSIFLHGGWWHLIGNMLYLSIFGDNVEDRLGHGRYLLFYMAGGVLAGLAQIWFTPGSTAPAIGASGAVAAVLGTYMVLYPRARVRVLFFIFFFIQVISIPALLVLGLWFVTQLFNGVFSLTAASAAMMGGVAWWAHVGGFVMGIIVGLLLRRRPPRAPQPYPPRPYYTYYR